MCPDSNAVESWLELVTARRVGGVAFSAEGDLKTLAVSPFLTRQTAWEPPDHMADHSGGELTLATSRSSALALAPFTPASALSRGDPKWRMGNKHESCNRLSLLHMDNEGIEEPIIPGDSGSPVYWVGSVEGAK